MEMFWNMVSDYKYIFILCILVVVVSAIMYFIRLIMFPRKRDEYQRRLDNNI